MIIYIYIYIYIYICKYYKLCLFLNCHYFIDTTSLSLYSPNVVDVEES